MRVVILITMAFATALAAQADDKASVRDRVNRLLDLELKASNACQNATTSSLAEKACQEHRQYALELNRLGWCLGRQREVPHKMKWHRCGTNSIKLGL